MLDSSLFFTKGCLQLLLHHFKQLFEKLDDLRVNRIAYSYCNFYHRPECLTLRSRKSFPAQHDWLPSNTCKRYCPGYISDMPARKNDNTKLIRNEIKKDCATSHRQSRRNKTCRGLDKHTWQGLKGNFKWQQNMMHCELFLFNTNAQTWITWHCESKFTSWKLYHLKLNHFKASLIINIVLFIHLLFVKLHHIPSNLILPCRAFHAYNLGFPWSDSSEREAHFVNRVTHTRYLKEDSP